MPFSFCIGYMNIVGLLGVYTRLRIYHLLKTSIGFSGKIMGNNGTLYNYIAYQSTDNYLDMLINDDVRAQFTNGKDYIAYFN